MTTHPQAELDRLRCQVASLQSQNMELALRHCLECETVTPVRIENLQSQVATLRELLRQAHRLIQAFSRHYAAASDTDAIAAMIQFDRWQAFQECCGKVCAQIYNCLHNPQNGV